MKATEYVEVHWTDGEKSYVELTPMWPELKKQRTLSQSLQPYIDQMTQSLAEKIDRDLMKVLEVE